MKQLLLLFLFVTPSLGFASRIKVREHKFYREFMVKEKVVLVHKKSPTILHAEKSRTLSFTIAPEGQSFSFHKVMGNKDHYLLYRRSNNRKLAVGYLARSLTTFFKSDSCDIKTTDFRETVEFAESLALKVRSTNVASLIDKNSCRNISPIQLEMLKTALINNLKDRNTGLSKCLDGAEFAQKVFEKDPALRNNAVEVFSRYLRLVDDIIGNKSELKIKCGLPAAQMQNVAMYSENPSAIMLNLPNQDGDSSVEENPDVMRDELNSALMHELMHAGGQQFKNQPNSRCLDEGFVRLQEEVCNYKPESGGSLPKHSSEIVECCVKNGKDCSGKSVGGFVKGPERIAAYESIEPKTLLQAVSSQPIENKNESAAITRTIASLPAEQLAFKPITGGADGQTNVQVAQAVQTLANDPKIQTESGRSISEFAGDGEFHHVVVSPAYEKSITEMVNTVTANADQASRVLNLALENTGVTGTLGAAVASSTKVAQASDVEPRKSSLKRSPAVHESLSGVEGMSVSEMFLRRYYPENKAVMDAIEKGDLKKFEKELLEKQNSNGDNKQKLADSKNDKAKLNRFDPDVNPNFHRETGGQIMVLGPPLGSLAEEEGTKKPSGANATTTSDNAAKAKSTDGNSARSVASTPGNLESDQDNKNPNNSNQNSGQNQNNVQNQAAQVGQTSRVAGPSVNELRQAVEALTAKTVITEPSRSIIMEKLIVQPSVQDKTGQDKKRKEAFEKILARRNIQIYGPGDKPLIPTDKPSVCFQDSNVNGKRVLKRVPCIEK